MKIRWLTSRACFKVWTVKFLNNVFDLMNAVTAWYSNYRESESKQWWMQIAYTHLSHSLSTCIFFLYFFGLSKSIAMIVDPTNPMAHIRVTTGSTDCSQSRSKQRPTFGWGSGSLSLIWNVNHLICIQWLLPNECSQGFKLRSWSRLWLRHSP